MICFKKKKKEKRNPPCGLHIALFPLAWDPKALHMLLCFCTVEFLFACVHGVIILSPTGKTVCRQEAKHQR